MFVCLFSGVSSLTPVGDQVRLRVGVSGEPRVLWLSVESVFDYSVPVCGRVRKCGDVSARASVRVCVGRVDHVVVVCDLHPCPTGAPRSSSVRH